jgi:hypothetical protein
VTSKEIHECEVPKWKKKIEKIVCVFEKDLPTSFMNLQVHLITHLVDGIELAVSVRSHSWIACRSRAQRPSVLCHDLINGVIEWKRLRKYSFDSGTGSGM